MARKVYEQEEWWVEDGARLETIGPFKARSHALSAIADMMRADHEAAGRATAKPAPTPAARDWPPCGDFGCDADTHLSWKWGTRPALEGRSGWDVYHVETGRLVVNVIRRGDALEVIDQLNEGRRRRPFAAALWRWVLAFGLIWVIGTRLGTWAGYEPEEKEGEK